MYARAVTYTLKPGAADQLLQAARDIEDDIRHLPGFQRAYALVDREGNRAMTITVFDSREHAEALAQNDVRQRFVDHASGIVEGPPSVAVYEVAIQVEV